MFWNVKIRRIFNFFIFFTETVPKDQDPEKVLAHPNDAADPGSEGLGSDLILGDGVLHHVLEHHVDPVLVTGRDDVGPDPVHLVPCIKYIKNPLNLD